jgi:hypothetical protein
MSNVNHPTHYNQGTIEVIDYVKDSLTDEEYLGFIKGNVIKYIARANYKNGTEDLEKAHWYLTHYLNGKSTDICIAHETPVSDLTVIEIELLKQVMADCQYIMRTNSNVYASNSIFELIAILLKGPEPNHEKELKMSHLKDQFLSLREGEIYYISDILKQGTRAISIISQGLLFK